MNNRFLTFAAAIGIVCFTGFTASAHHGPDGFDRTMQVIDRVTRILFPPVTVVTPAPAPVVVAPAPPVVVQQPAYAVPPPVVAPPVYMAPPPPPPRPRCVSKNPLRLSAATMPSKYFSDMFWRWAISISTTYSSPPLRARSAMTRSA